MRCLSFCLTRISVRWLSDSSKRLTLRLALYIPAFTSSVNDLWRFKHRVWVSVLFSLRYRPVYKRVTKSTRREKLCRFQQDKQGQEKKCHLRFGHFVRQIRGRSKILFIRAKTTGRVYISMILFFFHPQIWIQHTDSHTAAFWAALTPNPIPLWFITSSEKWGQRKKWLSFLFFHFLWSANEAASVWLTQDGYLSLHAPC